MAEQQYRISSRMHVVSVCLHYGNISGCHGKVPSQIGK